MPVDKQYDTSSDSSASDQAQAYIDNLTPAEQAEWKGALPSADATRGLLWEGQHGKAFAQLPVDWNVLGVGQQDAGGVATEIPGAAGTTPPAATTKAPAAATTPAPSAAEGLLNDLAGQYQSMMATVDPYIGGSNNAGFQQEATAMGEGIAGAGVQSQNATNAAVLNKDASAVQAATDAGAGSIATALKDTGSADAEALQVSPYLGILNALTSEAQYKTETGTPPTSITGANMPSWLEQAYQKTIGSSDPGTSTVGATPAVSTSATTPSTDTTSVAGGGNA